MPGPPSARAVGTIAGASLLTTLGTLPVFLLASQSVLVRQELGFGERLFGVAVGLFFASAAAAAVLGGRLADRAGRRTSTIVAGTLSAAGCLGVSLGVGSWWWLAVLMAVLGVANAACQVTANLAMARSVPAHRRGLGFGVKQSAIPTAIVLAGLAVPSVTAAWGWRSTFLLAGLASLLVVVVGVVRRPVAAISTPPSADVLDEPPVGALLVSMAAIGLGSAAANSLGAFASSWGYEVGLSPAEAGLLMALGSVLNVAMRLVSGVLADRRHGRNLPVVAAQMLVGAAALAVVSVGEPVTYVAGVVVAFGVGWSWPGLMLYAVVRISRDSPGTASGYVQAGAFGGGAAGPLLFGLLVDAVGYRASWLVAATVLAAAGLLVVVARRLFLADLLARPPREPFGYGGGRSAPRRVTWYPPDDCT